MLQLTKEIKAPYENSVGRKRRKLTFSRAVFAFVVVLGSFLFFAHGASAATSYWVGGTGNWTDATNHWSATSGGAPGAGNLPTSATDVIFDASSSPSGYTVTANAAANCLSMTWANPATGTTTLAGSSDINVYGNLTLPTDMKLTATSWNMLQAYPGTSTITTNGVSVTGSFKMGGYGYYQLADNFTFVGFRLWLSAGNFLSNSKTVTVNFPNSAGSISLLGNFQYSPFYNLTVTGGSTIGEALYVDGITVTNNLVINGNSSTTNRMLVRSGTAGTPAGIMVNGNTTFSNVDFRDIFVAPAGTNKTVVTMGDSITNTTYSNALQVPLVRYSGGDWYVMNAGTGGNKTSDMLTRFARDVTNVPGVQRVVILGGINDIMSDVSVGDTETNLQTMYTTAHNAGLTVVALTLTPFKNYVNWSAGRQTTLETLNTWIKTQATNVDYVVDTYNIFLDPSTAYTMKAAYSLDWLHMNSTGSTLLANSVFAGATWTAAGTSPAWDLGAISGGSGDAGGNSRISFTPSATLYWKHGSTANVGWSTTGNWYLGSNGTGGVGRVPLPQDDVIFDGSSFSAASKYVNMSVSRLGRSLTFTNVTNSPTFTVSYACSLFGSLSLPPSANWSFVDPSFYTMTFEGRGNYTITSNGNTFVNENPVINAPGGTYTLLDTFNTDATHYMNITGGTVVASSKLMNVVPTTAYTVAGGTLNLYNNTIWRSSAAGTLVNMTSGSVSMRNNIFSNINDVLSSSGGTSDLANNDYFNSSNEGGTGSITSDPLFISSGTDFHLASTSPAIDIGTTTGITSTTTDYGGNLIYGIPDIGAYDYQPLFTMSSNPVATSSVVRMYGDEKWRPKTATTTNGTASLNISIPGSDTTKWLDITVSLWNASGDYHKTWTETSSTTGLTNTVHVVGDLAPSAQYIVAVDGSAGLNITGDACSSGVCTANGSGQITFTYTGTYSDHTFDVSQNPVVVPTVTTSAATGVSTSTMTLNGNMTNDGNASSTVRGFAYGTDPSLTTVIATTTETGTFGTGAFTKVLTGLTPNTLYYFRAYSTNSAGTSTGTILQATTTDTTPPTVSLTSPSGGSTVAGSTISLSSTASDDVGVIGVRFMLDGTTNINAEVTSTSSPNTYTTTWDSTGITSYGSHTLYAVARDAAGNHSTSTVTVNVDNVAPTLVSAVYDSSTQITVTLSKLANASTITKSNDGGFTVTKTGTTTTYAVTSIAPGSDNTKVVLTVANMDTAGGTGVKVTYTATGNGTIADTLGNLLATNNTGVTIPPWNTTAPIISSITSTVANGAYKLGSSIDIDLTFSKTVDTTGSVVVTLNTGGTCSFSGISNSTTASCTYTVGSSENIGALNVTSVAGTIVSTDSNPMTSFTPALNLSANKNIVIDTTAPSVSITSPSDGSTVSGISVTPTATNSDAGSGIAGVRFVLDGTTDIGSEGLVNPYSITWNSKTTTNATHMLQAVARDVAGNYATSSVTVTVNNIEPVEPAVPTPSAVTSHSSQSGGSAANRVSNLLRMGLIDLAYAVANQFGIIMPTQTPVVQKQPLINSSPVPPVPPAPISNSPRPFTSTLSVGTTNAEVKRLQVFLNAQGFVVAGKGAGSPGHETDYFGPATKAALMKFQLAHKKETLDPQGLKSPTGFFGRDTMKTVNRLGGLM